LEKKIDKYPELFPKEIKEGFRLHGFVTSVIDPRAKRRLVLGVLTSPARKQLRVIFNINLDITVEIPYLN
jgi:hypothetical protein